LFLLAGVCAGWKETWNGTWGYVPVSSGNASGELFYWYFPARNGNASAPLLLWLQGGPGASSIEDGLLRINGPYRVENGSLAPREVSWNNEFAILYVDSPVGTGYSTATGYASTQTEISQMLVQLLKTFPTSHLVLCGESYGGHYLPPLGVAAVAAGLPVRGVAIGDGLTDPETQVVTKPVSAFHFGLIDEGTLLRAQAEAEKARLACSTGAYVAAKGHRESMEDIVVDASQINPYDVRKFGDYDDSAEVAFLNSSETLATLGARKYFGTESGVADALEADVMRSYKADIQSLLFEHEVPVLLYQGQFDWKDGATSNEAWIRSIGHAEYLSAPRTVLGSPSPYGWLKKAPPLYDAVLSSAGHMSPMDQPEAALDLITRFVQGRL